MVFANSGSLISRSWLVFETEMVKVSMLGWFDFISSTNLSMNDSLSIMLNFFKNFDLFMTFTAFWYCISSSTFLNSKFLMRVLPTVREWKCLQTRLKLLKHSVEIEKFYYCLYFTWNQFCWIIGQLYRISNFVNFSPKCLKKIHIP